MYMQIVAELYKRRMEHIEDIDPWNSKGPQVSLKGGLDLTKLSDGVLFEIDPDSAQQPSGHSEDDSFRREDILKQLNLECIDFGGNECSDSEDQLSPFEKMAREMTPVPDTEGNVLKKVLRRGTGELVPEGATVRVHYNGYLEYSDEPYDSSRLRNRPMQFKLGQGEVIEGWDLGVATMQRTEVARFLVSSNYAFGKHGCPPRIPPNATIMFEIEVMNYVDCKAADDFRNLTSKEKKEASLEQLIAVANAEKEVGNDFFGLKMYGKASSKYFKAVRLLEPARLKDEAEEKQWKAILLKLYLNQSLVSLKLSKYQLAVAQCKKVLDMQPENVKAHFRLGQAYMQLGDFKNSRVNLLKAGRLSPGNQEIRLELLKLDRAVTKYKKMEKLVCSRMVDFSEPSPPPKPQESDENVEIRKQFLKELALMKEKVSMRQMVLPQILTLEQEECAKQVAVELGLKTEKESGCGLRIFKEEEELPANY